MSQPPTNASRYRTLDGLTPRVIAAFHTVYNALGYGFLEAVYANAMAVEFTRRGIGFVREARFTVRYLGVVVGTGRVDFLVEGWLLVELKAGRALLPGDRAQLYSYLRASERPLGLLLHFGVEPLVRRVP